MTRPSSFSVLWHNYLHNRPLAQNMYQGNRCALALSITLGDRYQPKQDTELASFQDLSLRDIRSKPERVRGERVESQEDGYYINAKQLANRLKLEWGDPEVVMIGFMALGRLRHTQGVLFIEHSVRWIELSRTSGVRLGDHIDLWNGSVMGSVPEAKKCDRIIELAQTVWFWRIY